MIRERLVETLDKYIIMDDVNLTDEADLFGTLALEGPKSAEAVAQLSGVDLSSLGELSTIDAAVATLPCRITRRSPGGIPGAEFLIARDNLAALWQILAEKIRALGGTPMGYSALSALRLEQGVPGSATISTSGISPTKRVSRTRTSATRKDATRGKRSSSACAPGVTRTVSASR